MSDTPNNAGERLVRFPVAVIIDRQLSMAARMLFVILCSAADSRRRAAITLGRMAELADASRWSVEHRLREPKYAGWFRSPPVGGRIIYIELSEKSADG